MKKMKLAAAVLAMALASAGAIAAEKGTFGFSLAVESEGLSLNPMNPTLKSATVDKVVAGSPAEAAGLSKGDQLLAVEGRAVAGAKANDLKPHLARNVGEAVSLRVKKASGEVVAVTLLAGKVTDHK